jgi:hypothetical protein
MQHFDFLKSWLLANWLLVGSVLFAAVVLLVLFW